MRETLREFDVRTPPRNQFARTTVKNSETGSGLISHLSGWHLKAFGRALGRAPDTLRGAGWVVAMPAGGRRPGRGGKVSFKTHYSIPVAQHGKILAA